MARVLGFSPTGDTVQFEVDAVPAAGNPLVLDTGGATGKATVGASGAATLNKQSGFITTEALTTAAGADFTETVANAKITSSDLIFVNVANGTNTGGSPVVSTVACANGSVTIKIHHAGAAAFNGTLKIGFVRFGV